MFVAIDSSADPLLTCKLIAAADDANVLLARIEFILNTVPELTAFTANVVLAVDINVVTKVVPKIDDTFTIFGFAII
jgi:hypothetical protein